MNVQSNQTAVIVLNWNGYDDTCECLKSIFLISDNKIKVYVVDNASSDGSAGKLKLMFGNKIILLQNSENLLYAGGNNVGIKKALEDGCSHILLLNNDTIVDVKLISELQKASTEYVDAILCPKIYYLKEPNKLWYAGGNLSLYRARASHRGIREIDEHQYDKTEETDWATGCAMYAPRHLWEKVGFLDESFELYSEDLDYCLRAKKNGFKIIFVPQAKVWHKVSSSVGGNFSKNKLKRKWRSLNRLLSKHIDSPILRIYAILDFVVTEPFRILFKAVQGKLS